MKEVEFTMGINYIIEVTPSKTNSLQIYTNIILLIHSPPRAKDPLKE